MPNIIVYGPVIFHAHTMSNGDAIVIVIRQRQIREISMNAFWGQWGNDSEISRSPPLMISKFRVH